jgi:hypothetical protein
VDGEHRRRVVAVLRVEEGYLVRRGRVLVVHRVEERRGGREAA